MRGDALLPSTGRFLTAGPCGANASRLEFPDLFQTAVQDVVVFDLNFRSVRSHCFRALVSGPFSNIRIVRFVRSYCFRALVSGPSQTAL